MANEIFTRIQLKHDSYANWNAVKDTFKPLPGEICIAEIPTGNAAATTAPTVLFKVGAYKKDASGNNTTELHTFAELPWASALAADVYAWAKKPEAEFITWVNDQIEHPTLSVVDPDAATKKFITKVEASDHQITITRSDVDWNDVKNAPDFALAADLGEVNTLTTTAKTAVGAINEHDSEIGDLASLNTTNKGNLVSAINEALQAVEVGGTGSVVTVTKQETPSKGSEATYVVKQGGNAVDVKIEIPKYDTSADYGILEVAGENAIKVETENQKATAKLVLDNTGNVAFSQSTVGLKAEVTHVAEAGKVDNALTIKVGGTDVVFDGSAAQTANVDAAIAAAIAEEGHPEYAIEKDANAGEYAAVYHLTKDGVKIAGSTINIPKDMVVESGEVVTNPDGQPAGTYIKLVLQNVADPLYINVGDLIEYVTSGSDSNSQVIVTVSDDYKVTATIGAGKVGETELAANAVTTVKIADGNVTEAKLEQNVQNALALARNSKQQQTALADKGLTGANVLASLSQNANGEIAYETRALTPADIGAQPAGNYQPAGSYKITQGEKDYTGSTVKTVTEVKQDTNGVITEVKFEDIAFPAPPKGTGDVAIATIENDIVTLNGGVKLNGHKLEDDTTKNDITLAKIAKTGSIYDVKEGSVEGTSDADKAIELKYLVFNCGTAFTVI